MLAARVLASADFDHRVLDLVFSPAADRFVITAPDRSAALLAADLSVLARWKFTRKPVALDLSSRELLVADEESLAIWNLATPQPSLILPRAFQACAFTRDERFVCTARHIESEIVEVELRDGKSLQLLAQAQTNDPFGDGDCVLFRHPHADVQMLWIAAGQDGQVLQTVRIGADALTITPFSDLLETGVPAFSRDGSRALLVHAWDEVRHYTVPDATLIGTLHWDGENDEIDSCAGFLGDDVAIVWTRNGRLFAVDTRAMQLIGEIAVPNHEPRPLSQLYGLDDDSLGSGLNGVLALGDGRFVSTHQRLPAPPLEWRDTMLIWTVSTSPGGNT